MGICSAFNVFENGKYMLTANQANHFTQSFEQYYHTKPTFREAMYGKELTLLLDAHSMDLEEKLGASTIIAINNMERKVI